MPPVKKCQAEQPADTNQVGSNFHPQPATSDNPDNRPIFLGISCFPLSNFSWKISLSIRAMSRALIKRQRPGVSPGYDKHDLRLLS